MILKNSNMKHTKFGSIFNILYTPNRIPKSLRKQLQTGTPAMSSPNEVTQQYDVKDLIEDYKEDPSFYNEEEKEFIKFLLENDIDYIEI